MRLASTLTLVLAVSTAHAGEIYRYVEKDGTVVYTNVAPKGKQAASAKKMAGEFRPAPGPSVAARITNDTSNKLTEYDEAIEAAALRYRIPSNLIRAVMHAESAFDPNALSAVGASGLMQLMPGTAQEMFVKDIFDAEQNIDGGARYLRVLANEFDGDMVKMVAAYNAGPDAVRKYGGQIPPYAETQGYVRKVLGLYFQYKAKSQTDSASANTR